MGKIHELLRSCLWIDIETKSSWKLRAQFDKEIKKTNYSSFVTFITKLDQNQKHIITDLSCLAH